jgi:hypothetical protein
MLGFEWQKKLQSASIMVFAAAGFVALVFLALVIWGRQDIVSQVDKVVLCCSLH